VLRVLAGKTRGSKFQTRPLAMEQFTNGLVTGHIQGASYHIRAVWLGDFTDKKLTVTCAMFGKGGKGSTTNQYTGKNPIKVRIDEIGEVHQIDYPVLLSNLVCEFSGYTFVDCGDHVSIRSKKYLDKPVRLYPEKRSQK